MKKAKRHIAPRILGHFRAPITGLGDEAAHGSRAAAMELIEIGILAASLIDEAYRSQPELIRDISTRHYRFPILYAWRKDENKKRIALAKKLNLGGISPFTTMGNLRLDRAYDAIVHTVWHELDEMRTGIMEPKNQRQRQICRRIRALKPLSLASIKQWSAAFADYHINFNDIPRMDPNDVFYRLAAPDRELRTRQRLSRARMEEKFGAEQLDAIQATKKQAWERKIASMKVTPRSFRNRLVEALSKRLGRMMKR